MLGFHLFAILFAVVIIALGKYSKMPVRKETSIESGSALTVIFVGLVMGAWIIATRGNTIEARFLSPIILPSPLEVLRAFPILHYKQALVRSVIISFGRITSGFALATIIALPLGVQMAAYPKIAAFFRPLALIGGYIPIVVFIPLSLAWFGIGEMQKIGFLFIGCFVVLLPAVIRAIDNVPDDYLNLAATKGASQWQLVSNVMLPVAAPAIWDSLRTVYGVGWGWIILAEIVNGDRGMGYLISISERRGQTASTYAIIIVICVIAVACDQIWRRIGQGLFPYMKKD
jgi:NitT/TauT family transport system permease protein